MRVTTTYISPAVPRIGTLAASLLARPWASMPRVPTMASPSTHACVYAAVAPPFVLPFAAGLNDQRVSPSSHPTNPRVTVHLPSFRMPSTSWSRYMVASPLAKEVALTVRGIHEMTSVRIFEFKVFGAYLYSSPVYGA